MGTWRGLGCVLALASFALPLAAEEPEPLTFQHRLGIHAARTCGAGAVAGGVTGALINQWRDEPHEWGQGSAGFGRRFGYRQARSAAGNSIELGAGVLLREDPRYFPSAASGVWRRTAYAVRAGFVANGRPAWARFAGAYGGAMVSLAWYPPHYTALDGLSMASITLGTRTAQNIFLEFWPDIRRIVLRRK